MFNQVWRGYNSHKTTFLHKTELIPPEMDYVELDHLHHFDLFFLLNFY